MPSPICLGTTLRTQLQALGFDDEANAQRSAPRWLASPLATSRRTVPATERHLAPTEFVVRIDQPMSAAMAHVERSMIQYALKTSGGRVEEAAERLGLSRKGLYLKRQRLHISDAPVDGRSPVPQ
jgi:DNA-binding NtrC family response regulator